MLAKKVGLKVMALTDHDTIGGIAQAASQAQKEGIDFIPGIELKAKYKEENIRSMHIVGLYINPESKSFNEFIEKIQQSRIERNDRYIEYFNQIGYNISYEKIFEVTGKKGGIIAKPHFVQTLLSMGFPHTKEEIYEDFFSKEPLCSMSSYVPDPKTVIEEIHKAGGVAILAHPYLLKKDRENTERIIKKLKDFGIDGIEKYHSEHDESYQTFVDRLAEKYNLIISAGSDFHGLDAKYKVYFASGTNNNVLIDDLSIVEEIKEKRDEIRVNDAYKKRMEKRQISRAIIIKDNKLLTFRRIHPTRNNKRPYWVFPGGGKEEGETLRNNLKREVKEEIDSLVKSQRLFATLDSSLGLYEHYYLVELEDYSAIKCGEGDGTEFVDKSRGTYDIAWLDINKIGKYDLKPNVIRDKLIEFLKDGQKQIRKIYRLEE